MRKTLLFTTVIILAFSLVLAWAEDKKQDEQVIPSKSLTVTKSQQVTQEPVISQQETEKTKYIDPAQEEIAKADEELYQRKLNSDSKKSISNEANLSEHELLKIKAEQLGISVEELTHVESIVPKSTPGFATAVGDDCSDPSVIDIDNIGDLPISLTGESTADALNDYDATCLGNYDGGEDFIYEINNNTGGTITVTITASNINTSWGGMVIDSVCPPGASCMAYDAYGTPLVLEQIDLEPGSYYLMLDTYPSPDSMDYDLTIEEYVIPTGRCCDYTDPLNPVCTDGVEEADCQDASDVWAEGLDCTNDPCPSVIGNNCDYPITLTDADLPYTETGQTTCDRGDDYDATCLGSYDGDEDIIYSFTNTGAEAMEISIDVTDATEDYIGILADTTCPAGSSCLAYATGSYYSFDLSLSQVNVDAGQTVYIMIDNYAEGCYDFDLAITEFVAPVEGDSIENAYTISSLPYTDAGTTSGFTDNYVGSCGTHVAAPDVVYSFSPAVDTFITVDLCESSYDTRLYVFENDETTEIACDDDGCPSTITTTRSMIKALYITSGNTYYFVVDGYNSYSGNYEIAVDYAAAPDPGENCSTALEITSFPYTFSDDLCSYESYHRYDGPDVVWTFTLADSTTLLFSLCDSDSIFYDYLVLYNDGECGGDYITYGYDGCESTAMTEFEYTLADGTYFLMLDGGSYAPDCGEFTLNVSEVVEPTDACCYGDVYSPSCVDDVTEEDCYDTYDGFAWIEGSFCADDPCPPGNDLCENALDLGGSFPITGSSTTINTINTECDSLLDWDNTVWFTFDIPNEYNDVEITICGATVDLYNVGVVLMDDCACDDYILYTDYEWFECTSGYDGITISYWNVPGGASSQIYWPAMAENSSYAGMDFTYEINVISSPTGRCCYYDEEPPDMYNPICADGVIYSECVDLIDIYSGFWNEGLDCSSPCPLPPDNDLCANAEPVTIGTSVIGNTSYATVDQEVPDCTWDPTFSYPGVWYSVTGNGNILTASTCNAVTQDSTEYFDTRISVFTGDCEDLVCIGGDDDGCEDYYSLASIFEWCSEVDVEYKILVHGYNSSDVGMFQLDIIDGDTCSPAIGRCCYGDYYDYGCVDNVTLIECFSNYDGVSWVEGEDCTTDPCPIYPGFDLDVDSLYGSVEEAGPGNIAYDAVTVSNIGTDELTFTAKATIDPPAVASGLPIYYTELQNTIDARPAKNNSDYVTPPAPDRNTILQGGDDISSATVFTSVPYNDSGTTSGYTDDYDEVCPYDSSTSPDVVYSYTPSVDEYINVDLYGSSYDTKVYVYENDATTLVDCNDDYWSDYTSALFNMAFYAGNTYYIVVDGYGGYYGDYVIQVEYGVAPPECPDTYYNFASQITAGGNSYGLTSDSGVSYKRYDNFGGAYGIIEGIRFWGVLGYYDSGWSECSEDPLEVEIGFYEDDSGLPGTEVYSETFTYNPVASPWTDGNGWVIYEFDATFATSFALYEGWVSIQGVSDPATCWFLSSMSEDGDGASIYYYGAWYEDDDDLSFCLYGTYEEPWLSIDVEADTIAVGGAGVVITAAMNSENLSGGTYTGKINFNTNDPVYSSFSLPVRFDIGGGAYEYLPGDANMANESWPAQTIGGDVTYLVNYFRGLADACMLDGFYASADATGDCLVVGGDVTYLVNYFRGLADMGHCADYEPAWPTPSDVPANEPDGWPNCDTEVITGDNTIQLPSQNK